MVSGGRQFTNKSYTISRIIRNWLGVYSLRTIFTILVIPVRHSDLCSTVDSDNWLCLIWVKRVPCSFIIEALLCANCARCLRQFYGPAVWEDWKPLYGIYSRESFRSTQRREKALLKLLAIENRMWGMTKMIAYLIIRQRERKGGKTRPEFSQMRINRHLATYFSMVRRRAAWASRVSASTLLIITVLKDLN